MYGRSLHNVKFDFLGLAWMGSRPGNMLLAVNNSFLAIQLNLATLPLELSLLIPLRYF